MLYDNDVEGKKPDLGIYGGYRGGNREREVLYGACMQMCMEDYGHGYGSAGK